MNRRWVFHPATGRYTDQLHGVDITEGQLRKLRDLFLEDERVEALRITEELSSQNWSLEQWEVLMRASIKRAHAISYMLGRGGRNAMTQQDWGRIGRRVRDQYGFLHEFAKDIASGKQTIEEAKRRVPLYIGAAKSGLERGSAQAKGVPKLPAYPGDGSTECLGNCYCSWQIDRTNDDEWQCTWLLGDADNCATCLDRSRKWKPLLITDRKEN